MSSNFEAIGPDIDYCMNKAKDNTKRLLNAMQFENGGPAGNKYILKAVMKADRWKYKQSHYGLNQRHEQV